MALSTLSPSWPRRETRAPQRSLSFLGPGDPDHLERDSACHLRHGQFLRATTRQLYSYVAADNVANPYDAFVPVPDLAAGLPKIDDLAATVALRRGTGVTARDFTELLASNAISPTARHYIDDTIADIRPAGDHTLIVVLRQPANDLTHLLAMGCLSPASAAGPYRVAATHDGDEILLEPDPRWSQENDSIRRRAFSRIRLCRSGGGSGLPAWPFTTLSWQQWDGASENFPRNYPGYGLNPYLVLNLQGKSPLRNADVRRAVASSIDRGAIAAILNRLPGVFATPTASLLLPGTPGHDERARRDANPSPELARALLSRAGYGDGITLTAAVRDVELHRAVMRSIAGDLERCGMRLDVRLIANAEYYGMLMDAERARSGEWDMAEVGWAPDWFGNNGRCVLDPILRTNRNRGATNYGGYSNPTVDMLLDDALAEADPGRAAQRWRRVDTIVLEEAAIIPILAFACVCCAARTGAGSPATWPVRERIVP